jgi:D-3-phosphoglycerate dehydrogenase
MVSLEELFRESDVVTIHVRLTPDTQNMVNQKLVSLMKPSAYLINTARAGLMDEEAFRDAILNKRIAGAALDVFWKEPIPADDALVQADNVTLTSHIAGLTVDAIPNSPSMLAEAINDYLKNGTRDLIVNAKSVSSESIEELRTM